MRRKVEVIMGHRFKIILEWNEDEGGYTVTVPALPGCVTEGDTEEESLVNAKEAITSYLKALKKLGRPIPAGDLPVKKQELVINT